MADTIKVQKKSNPSVTRTIQLKALPVFQRRGWVATDPSLATIPEVKKKPVVEPVEVPAKLEVPEREHETPFAPIGDDKPVDALRDEYKTLTGKDADKRWSTKRLIDEIANVNE